jgi:phosphoribosylformylglycinamidine synthase
MKAAVVVFPGSNGDRDLFECLSSAGFAPRYVASSDPLPHDCQLVGLPGGFSFGDYWRAGVLASRDRAVGDLADFPGLVIGICNGFQTLVEAGYLPGALCANDPPGFRHSWVDVEVTATASPWFTGIAPGTRLRMPRAHGEGNYFHPEGELAARAITAATYVQNPNGSMADAAAVHVGRFLGIMPHPERACDPHLGSADGLKLFQAAHRYLA